MQTVLAQGEPHGRGRAVARAMERVLVGTRQGRPAPGAPRSGLAPAVEAEVAALRLPGPHDTDGRGTARDLRLDPLRSDLDRRRELLLRRMTVCGVPYGEPRDVTGTGGADALTSRWEVRWTPATAAMLTTAGVRGVTLAQAAEGTLRERRRAEHDEGGPTAAQTLAGLAQAAECGLAQLADERLDEAAEILPRTGTLPELLTGLALLDRLGAGHIPGLAATADRPARATAAAELLTVAAVRQMDGLTGSEDPADARALLELAHRADDSGGIRLADALARLAADGTPLMRGAAGAVRVLLGHEDAHVLGDRAASWVDGATDPGTRTALTARLTGLLTAAGPLLETAPAALGPLLDRVTTLPDRAFLDRLPALRARLRHAEPGGPRPAPRHRRGTPRHDTRHRPGRHLPGGPRRLDPRRLRRPGASTTVGPAARPHDRPGRSRRRHPARHAGRRDGQRPEPLRGAGDRDGQSLDLVRGAGGRDGQRPEPLRGAGDRDGQSLDLVRGADGRDGQRPEAVRRAGEWAGQCPAPARHTRSRNGQRPENRRHRRGRPAARRHRHGRP
ncbi:hypothetical protein GCM10020256_02360 [Streptomyces thermocoprophilus]